MTDLITAEEAQKLLDGKVMARGDLRDHAGSLARTVIVLHAELAQASADAKAAVAVEIEKAADSLLECSVWCDSQPRTDDGWRNGVTDARKHGMAAIRALAPASAVARLAGLRAERDEWKRLAIAGELTARHLTIVQTELAAANAREAGLRQAVTKYHLALDSRENGNTAGYRLQDEVQRILDMPWRQGAALAQPSTEGQE